MRSGEQEPASSAPTPPRTWPSTIGRVAIGAAVAAAIIGVLVQWAWRYYATSFSLPA